MSQTLSGHSVFKRGGQRFLSYNGCKRVGAVFQGRNEVFFHAQYYAEVSVKISYFEQEKQI
jgi:hypothetical protein